MVKNEMSSAMKKALQRGPFTSLRNLIEIGKRAHFNRSKLEAVMEVTAITASSLLLMKRARLPILIRFLRFVTEHVMAHATVAACAVTCSVTVDGYVPSSRYMW